MDTEGIPPATPPQAIPTALVAEQLGTTGEAVKASSTSCCGTSGFAR